MSYILDALRKSESERKQGRIPDLGTSVQMVHKTRRAGLHWSVWIVLALVVNAGVVAYLFWPRPVAPAQTVVSAIASQKASTPGTSSNTAAKSLQTPAAVPAKVASSPQTAPALTSSSTPQPAATPSATTAVPTLIVPSSADHKAQQPAAVESASSSPSLDQPNSIPLLADESPSFQKQVPPLHFSGHIYSSVPSARRVVINDMYLGEGDWLGDLQVQRITESGVVFDLHGQLFRVGVVSDWTGPN